jgi:type II secretory pathway component PulC
MPSCFKSSKRSYVKTVVAIALRLTIIALLIYAGVTFWYGRVEERLQQPQPVASKQPEEAPGTEVMPESAELPETADISESAEEKYQIILTRNIFQAGLGDRSGQQLADVEDLSETKLQLSLLGTVTGEKDDARAIIRDEKTKLEDLYPAGASIQGAVINRITRGKVVLLVNGREEVLTIKDPDGGGQGQDMSTRLGARTMERGVAAPERDIMTKVPETQPRRRISFRNTPPPPRKVEQQIQQQPLDPDQAEAMDKQPVPDEGATPPGPEMEEKGEQ